MIQWACQPFAELSLEELYAIIQLRQQVFVVEQQCPYQDLDNKDAHAWHLCAWKKRKGARKLVAYLRLFVPGVEAKGAVIGRVIVAEAERGSGLGQRLMQQALDWLDTRYAAAPIQLSAQLYLHDFYTALGFAAQGDPYDEDGIPHIAMVKPGY